MKRQHRDPAPIPRTFEGEGRYMYCGTCFDEVRTREDVNPVEYAQLEIAWAAFGLQVWCRRHPTTALHILGQPRRRAVPMPPAA